MGKALRLAISAALVSVFAVVFMPLPASAVGQWTTTGNMVAAHGNSALVTLLDGRPFVVSGSTHTSVTETYDQTTGQWTQVGTINQDRDQTNPVVLDDGRVLIAGGVNAGGTPVASAELFDPVTGQWTYTGNLSVARSAAILVKLLDGRALLISGYTPGGQPSTISELYDPSTGQWTRTGDVVNPVVDGLAGDAVVLNDGRVLLVGNTFGSSSNIAQLYDPATGQWTTTGNLLVNRFNTRLIKLQDGRVLMIGGDQWGQTVTDCEIYDPTTGTWTSTGPLNYSRSGASDVVLADGRVLVAGGASINNGSFIGEVLPSEIYDPTSGTWSVDASLGVGHINGNLALLPNGKVLMEGGYSNNNSVPTTVSELYTLPAPAHDVTGTVYLDTNGNGVRDAGEPGYAGATVHLFSGPGGASLTETTAVTNASGVYTLSVPAADAEDWLRLDAPAGYQGTTVGVLGFGSLSADYTQDFGLGTLPTLLTVFSDSFTDTDGTTLAAHNSAWTVNQTMPIIQNNQLHEPSSGSSDPTGPFGFVMTDQCLSVDIQTPMPSGLALHIRQNPIVGQPGGYGSDFAVSGTPGFYDISLYHATTGDPYFPGGFSFPQALLSNGFHNRKLCAIGDQIRTYIDNILMIKAINSDWTQGIAHLGIIHDTVLDNVRVDGSLVGPAVYGVATGTRNSSGNNSLTATVGTTGIPAGATATVTVATGTFAGAVGCTDSKGNTYSVAADRNTGQGRLFVCSSHLATALATGDTITATYPGFSGISVISVNAIAASATAGTIVATSSANGNSAYPSSGTVSTNGSAVLLGVVASNSTPTFTPGAGYTLVGQVAGGSGSAKRTLSPEYRLVPSPGSYSATGTISNGGQFWQAALVAYLGF